MKDPTPVKNKQNNARSKYKFSFGKILALAGLVFFSAYSHSKVPEEIEKEILSNLREGPETLQYESVHETPIKDIYRVSLIDGQSIYTNHNGTFVFSGEMFAVKPGKFVSLSEIQKAQDRLVLLSQIDESGLLIYPAVGRKVSTINIFTDVDCSYCAKLHQEIPALNNKGIEVRYLAYPRSGLYSPSYSKIAAVWCSDNPKQLLPELQMGRIVELVDCDDNAVEEHYLLAKRLGVPGTPAIVFEDGNMISGYRSAEELANITNKIKSNKDVD